MSKLGKKPILIPKDTKVKVDGGKLVMTGPKGSRELTINDKIFTASISEDNNLTIKKKDKKENTNIVWGTTRSIINSALIGVSAGHEKTLELTGVGYRASLKGKQLNLQLGYSHDINFDIPEGIKITVEKQTLVKIQGMDKQLVGMIASKIKTFRPPEPYKGKGIKEVGQYILRKEGKKK